MSSLLSISDEARNIIINITVSSPITVILHAYEDMNDDLKTLILTVIYKTIDCKDYDIDNMYHVKFYKLEKNMKKYVLYEDMNITKKEYMQYYYLLKRSK